MTVTEGPIFITENKNLALKLATYLTKKVSTTTTANTNTIATTAIWLLFVNFLYL